MGKVSVSFTVAAGGREDRPVGLATPANAGALSSIPNTNVTTGIDKLILIFIM